MKLFKKIVSSIYKKQFIICTALLICLSHSIQTRAGIIDNRSTVQARIPSNLIAINTGYAIIVEKNSQKLFLYQENNGGVKLIEVYQCSSGRNRGDKSKRGDLKTPEGVYYFNKMHTDSQLPSRYGVMAFVTNYPNYVDQYNHKGGNGIWLHGIDRKLIPYDSKGCVALENESIRQLKDYIRLYQTPVIIENTVTYRTLDENRKIRQEVTRFLNKWKKAWSGKDLSTYINSYSKKRFRPPKGSWKRWKAYKQRLNNQYNWIDIKISNLNILQHDHVIAVTFYQDYRTESFKSSGFKELYLVRNSDALKIAAEVFTETAYVKKPEIKYVQTDQNALNDLLKNWLSAWENKDLNAYINYYSETFSTRKMNRDQWRAYKRKINRDNRLIKVKVIQPRITITGDRAIITFTQEYVSDTYSDYGIKNLILKKEKGQWKIVSETWEHI